MCPSKKLYQCYNINKQTPQRMFSKISNTFQFYVRLWRIGSKLKHKDIVKYQRERIASTQSAINSLKSDYKNSLSKWRKYLWRNSKKSNELLTEASFQKEQLIEMQKSYIFYQENYMSNPIKQRAIKLYNKTPYVILYSILYGVFLYHLIPKLFLHGYSWSDIGSEFLAFTILFLLFLIPQISK